jgi:hypothetical protein
MLNLDGSMRDDVEKAAEVSRRLVPLRDRLAELQAEERQIEGQIAECMRELAVATGSHAAVVFVGTDSASRILAVLRHQPDRIFSPAEVADILDIPNGQERANLRLLLSRMARDGRAARAGYGRYRAVPAT